MFLDFHKRPSAKFKYLTIFLMLALSGATLGTLWMGYELRTEQKAITRLLSTQAADQISTLAPFPEELRWQLAVSLILIVVLVSAFVVVMMIMQGYLQSQRSLRDLSRQAADILESMEQGVVTGDTSGRFIMMNREAQRMLGSSFPEQETTYDELDKRTGLSLQSLARELLKEGKHIEDRSFDFSHGGHQVHLLVTGHLLKDELGSIQGTVLHLRDVTERHLIQERIQRMEGYMGLGPVAAGLQHEIKNPLGALSLHVQLLAEHLQDHQDPEVLGELGILRTEIRRIGAVLENFSDYAHANVLNRSRIDLRDVIDRAVRLMVPQASTKGIQITTLQPDQPVQVDVDFNKVEQVIINLLLNAMEAMNQPGAIELVLTLQNADAVLEVIDQGPGVSRAAMDHLFDPYFTTKKNGLGMGLAVCRKIARQHAGELTCSNPGKGATFRLTLPISHHAAT